MFAFFEVKVTVRAHVIKIWLCAMSSELLILLQPNSIWWYIIINQSALLKEMDYYVQGQSGSKGPKCQ